jgi:hypothetical protein
MRHRLHLSAFAAAVMLASLAAPVAAQDYDPDRVIKGVDLDDLKAVVASLGHTIKEESPTGDVSLAALDEAGTIYILTGTACSDTGIGCQGVNMMVTYDGTADDLAKVNDVNMNEQALNTWYDPSDNTLGFTRYVVLDYGVTMANLRENVVVLLSVVPAALDRLE